MCVGRAMRLEQPNGVQSGRLCPQPLEFSMSALVEKLSARAKTLPPEDRARLAEIESGAVKLIPAEEVHAEARRLIRR